MLVDFDSSGHGSVADRDPMYAMRRRIHVRYALYGPYVEVADRDRWGDQWGEEMKGGERGKERGIIRTRERKREGKREG